ncbi:disintegrin and metalloproteinase domain-containing protein 33-like, partial [Orussus abietinus]
MASDIWWWAHARPVRCAAGQVQWKSVLLLVLLVAIAVVPAARAARQGPSTDFSSYAKVRPRVFHGRNKREISSTREADLKHADLLTVGLMIDGVERLLDLRLNTDLIPVGYQQRHQEGGTYKVHTPSKVELCHYQGSIRGVPGSWAAVSTCRGLRGTIFDGENSHHVQPEEGSLESPHYLYKQSDLIANKTCGYQGTAHQVVDREHRLHKRSPR